MPLKMVGILQRIEAFLEKHGMFPTQFGGAVMGDPNFVFDLRKSRHVPRDHTVEWVNLWIDAAESGRRLNADGRFILNPSPRRRKKAA